MAKKGGKGDAVMQFVEKELSKNPNIETSDLHEKAKSVDASVGKLSLRQFNARYPLQVKRRETLKKPRRRTGRAANVRGRRAAAKNREAVRDVFLGFAADLAAAEERKELVRVLAGVDRYVDEALKAARK
jgi:hypothetical protein